MNERQERKTTPLKAIRAKCLDCTCGQPREINACQIKDCALYAFRFGKNPYRAARTYTAEQKAKLTERLKRIKNA